MGHTPVDILPLGDHEHNVGPRGGARHKPDATSGQQPHECGDWHALSISLRIALSVAMGIARGLKWSCSVDGTSRPLGTMKRLLVSGHSEAVTQQRTLSE